MSNGVVFRLADEQLEPMSGPVIEWHVAEQHAAEAIRKRIGQAGVVGIKVIHTPAR